MISVGTIDTFPVALCGEVRSDKGHAAVFSTACRIVKPDVNHGIRLFELIGAASEMEQPDVVGIMASGVEEVGETAVATCGRIIESPQGGPEA